MKNENSRSAGFSLIELVFAMVFLTVIVFGVVNLQSSNLGMLNNQNREIQAHFLANQGLQIVSAIGYGDIQTFCSVKPYCKINFVGNSDYQIEGIDTAEEGELIDDLFTRSFTIDPTDLTTAYLVTVEVSWDDEEFLVTTKQIIY